MKILQKKDKVIFRFRCNRCCSLFEMTDDERYENDKKHNESSISESHNPLNKFDCPVCKTTRFMKHETIHKYFIMNDGSEIMDY